MNMKFERVAGPFGFTEGPVWDGEGVIFSDVPNDRILRYNVDTEECDIQNNNTHAANGLKMDAHGDLYACEMNGRRLARYSDEYQVITDRYKDNQFNSPNDLAIDTDGMVWFTDPFYDTDWEPNGKQLELDHRSVYRLDPDNPNTLTRMTDDTTNPNGILVSPSGETLYVAQSDYNGRLELRSYPITDDGTLGEYEICHNFAPHRGIDGMCFDTEGNIVATAGSDKSGPGSMIYVFTPSGRVLETHPVPDSMPTNCCFGNNDLQTLYLTGGDGYLYRSQTNRTGLLGA